MCGGGPPTRRPGPGDTPARPQPVGRGLASWWPSPEPGVDNRVAPPLERHSPTLVHSSLPVHLLTPQMAPKAAKKPADKKPAAKVPAATGDKKKKRTKTKARLLARPQPARTLTHCAGRVLQDLHLQGAEAGPPGHGHQLQGHVHHVRPPARLALPGRALSPSTRAGTRSSTTSSRRSPPRPPSWPATTRSRR